MSGMERISGPYKGYFIAAYSVPAGSLHIGYAKVCVARPPTVWSEIGVEKFTSAAGCRSELEAVDAAERKARRAIAAILDGMGPITWPGALTD
jgi:hypothetical protein